MWRYAVDVLSHFPEGKYVSLEEPAITCSGDQVHLYMIGVSEKEAGLSYQTEKIFMRLDTLGAR